MSMIKIENLTFSYPTSCDTIFDNVSFQIDTDWKLGFVGRNGRGKVISGSGSGGFMATLCNPFQRGTDKGAAGGAFLK